MKHQKRQNIGDNSYFSLGQAEKEREKEWKREKKRRKEVNLFSFFFFFVVVVVVLVGTPSHFSSSQHLSPERRIPPLVTIAYPP